MTVTAMAADRRLGNLAHLERLLNAWSRDDTDVQATAGRLRRLVAISVLETTLDGARPGWCSAPELRLASSTCERSPVREQAAMARMPRVSASRQFIGSFCAGRPSLAACVRKPNQARPPRPRKPWSATNGGPGLRRSTARLLMVLLASGNLGAGAVPAVQASTEGDELVLVDR